MHPNDSERNEPTEAGRKAEMEPLRGGYDPRAGDVPLAREFAERALAPLTSNLRNRQGRLDPGRISAALGLTGQQLAGCLEISMDQLRSDLPPDEREKRLEPFAMIIGIVRDSYGGDDKRVRLWLRTPRPELDGKTPNEALCVPSGLPAVVRFVLGAWLGNAD